MENLGQDICSYFVEEKIETHLFNMENSFFGKHLFWTSIRLIYFTCPVHLSVSVVHRLYANFNEILIWNISNFNAIQSQNV